jgi:hypothetical protein
VVFKDEKSNDKKKEKGEMEMKKSLMVIGFVIIALALVGSNAYAVTMYDWWEYASTPGAKVSNTDGTWLAGPANYDVEYLGLYKNGDTLYFALQTTWDLVSIPSDPTHSWIYNGDFVFDLNADNAADSALDFSIDSVTGDVAYDFYKEPGLVWDNGANFHNYDPIGVIAASSTKLSSFTITDAYRGIQDGSFKLTGYLTAANAEYASFDKNFYSVQWAMSCGNDGDKVTVVPEPTTIIAMALGLMGMYLRRKM